MKLAIYKVNTVQVVVSKNKRYLFFDQYQNPNQVVFVDAFSVVTMTDFQPHKHLLAVVSGESLARQSPSHSEHGCSEFLHSVFPGIRISREVGLRTDVTDLVRLRSVLYGNERTFVPDQRVWPRADVIRTVRDAEFPLSGVNFTRFFLDGVEGTGEFYLTNTDKWDVSKPASFEEAVNVLRADQEATITVLSSGKLTLRSFAVRDDGKNEIVCPLPGQLHDLLCLFWFGWFGNKTSVSVDSFVAALRAQLCNDIGDRKTLTLDMEYVIECVATIISNVDAKNKNIVLSNARFFFAVFGASYDTLLERMKRVQDALFVRVNDKLQPVGFFWDAKNRDMTLSFDKFENVLALWIPYGEEPNYTHEDVLFDEKYKTIKRCHHAFNPPYICVLGRIACAFHRERHYVNGRVFMDGNAWYGAFNKQAVTKQYESLRVFVQDVLATYKLGIVKSSPLSIRLLSLAAKKKTKEGMASGALGSMGQEAFSIKK